jgi:hypothetical protein
MRSSARRVALPALAVLALVGVVAIASRGSTPVAGSGGAAKPATVLLDTIFSLALVAMLASLVLLIYVFAPRGPRESPRGRGSLATLVALAMLLAWAFALLFIHPRRFARLDQMTQTTTSGASRSTSPNAAEHASVHHFTWLPFIVILVLAVLAVVAVWLVDRRRRARVAARQEVEEMVAGVLDDTLDDLLAEADPRRAVIAAYARLERVLAVHGLPRRAPETPEEYLARILAHLDVDPGSIRRLTDLFAWAKFSRHEVNPTMKEEAIAALVRVRDELRQLAAEREEVRTVRLATSHET